MEPEPRWIPDVGDRLEWNLVMRETYAAQELADGSYRPIPERTRLIANSFILAIGIKTELAPRSWHTGAWVSQNLAMTPGVTSEFPAFTKTCSYRIPRGQLTLCPFPKHQSPWFLNISFPHWFKEITCEVWRYDGRDLDAFTTGAIQTVPNTIPQSLTAVVLMEADPTRKGAIIMNEGDVPLALEFDTAPTMIEHLVLLQPGGYFEIPYGFKGQIQGVWASAGTGFAKIREFR